MDRPLKFKEKSSQIHDGSTYDPSTGRVTAVLNGAVGAYHNVSADLISEWEKSDSPGTFFHDHIKGRDKSSPIHKYTRVR